MLWCRGNSADSPQEEWCISNPIIQDRYCCKYDFVASGSIINVTGVSQVFRAALQISSLTQISSNIWKVKKRRLAKSNGKSNDGVHRICNWPTAVSCVEDPDAILPEHASSDRFAFHIFVFNIGYFFVRAMPEQRPVLNYTISMTWDLVYKLKDPSTNCRAPPKPRDPAFNAINVDDSDYEDTFQVWLKIPCRQKPWLIKKPLMRWRHPCWDLVPVSGATSSILCAFVQPRLCSKQVRGSCKREAVETRIPTLQGELQ